MPAAVDTAAAAVAARARRRIRRAAGLLREAAADAASLSGDVDTLGVVQITDDAAVQEVVELIRLARADRRVVDVVVLARPD